MQRLMLKTKANCRDGNFASYGYVMSRPSCQFLTMAIYRSPHGLIGESGNRVNEITQLPNYQIRSSDEPQRHRLDVVRAIGDDAREAAPDGEALVHELRDRVLAEQ